MSKLPSYPVQMASIKKNTWRMQSFIDQKLSVEKLKKEEHRLWNKIKSIIDNSSSPPDTCDFFPGSKLLGSGWEWAVYELPNTPKIVKVPAGIFPEVNNQEYLENTEFAYEGCKKYTRPFVVESFFERKKIMGEPVNLIFQKEINPELFRYIEPKKLPVKLKSLITDLGLGLLNILRKYDWMPDMNLYKKEYKGRKIWSIWNLSLEIKEPRIFDFTSYYDVFRLYPERTKKEIKIKGENWRKLLKELSVR